MKDVAHKHTMLFLMTLSGRGSSPE